MTASCGLEGGRVIHYEPLFSHALDLAAFKPKATIVLQRGAGPCAFVNRPYLDWYQAMASSVPAKDYAPVESDHPLCR